MEKSNQKLGVIALTALVIGGIIGSGIFSLPQNMAEGASAGAILIAWAITFVGMLALTRIFQWLATEHGEIDDGVYGYARAGFGDYMGFNAAWGYWISAWMGCAGYLVLMFSALGSFDSLAFFGDGTTMPALVCQLILLWLVHGFVLRGVHRAAMLNALVTCAKIVPIVLFIICAALAFKIDTFNTDFWGSPALGSLADQVKAPMLYTVWVFLGIESATVYATRARNMADVSRATLLGFMITITLLCCVSILSLGIVPQEALATMKNPSMAAVMTYAVGPWGGTLINIGLIISVSGAMLAWTLLSSEMLYLSGRGERNTSPAIFGRMNKAGTPAPALWLSNILVMVLLFINHFDESGYNAVIKLATSMVLIPYFLCAAYALKLALKSSQRTLALLLTTAVGTIYGIWLIYAADMEHLLLSMVLYMLGLPFFIKACRERKEKLFHHPAAALFALIVVGLGLFAISMVVRGKLTL